MSNIVPFESNKLPAYIKAVDAATLNADLTAHAGGGFPVISIKGKVFAVVRDGERNIIPNPKDPDSPATSIDMVIVKASRGTSKVWYASGYKEGSEGVKPDCWSNDGVKPDASVEKPVSKSCAVCPHNQWGSRVGDQGQGKGKACQDSVRLAVAQPGLVNDPYLLRVPPASIRSLGEYGEQLKKRGVGYNMVVTKIGFDMEAPTPKLTFKPVGFLPEDVYNDVVEQSQSDKVAQILGAVTDPVAAAPEREAPKPKAEAAEPPQVDFSKLSKNKAVTDDEVKSVIEKAAKPAAAKAKPAPATVEVDTGDLNLDDLNFDD